MMSVGAASPLAQWSGEQAVPISRRRSGVTVTSLSDFGSSSRNGNMTVGSKPGGGADSNARKSVGGKKQATAATFDDSRSTGSVAAGSPGLPGTAHHEGQMPARGAAGDAEAIGIDPVFLGVVLDEPHRAVHVVDDLGNGELRLAAVDDREDDVAAFQELGRAAGVEVLEHLLARLELHGDANDHAPTVRLLLGSEDVHREGDAVLAAVDHVLLALVVGRGGVAGCATAAGARNRATIIADRQRGSTTGLPMAAQADVNGSYRAPRDATIGRASG